MKAKNIIILLVVVLVVVIVFYSFQGSHDDTDYIQSITKEREEKDRYLSTAAESPFATNRESFKGLKYFEPDADYRIIANLYPIEDKKAVVLKTNDGKDQHYVEYAFGEFDVGNVKNRLLILESIEIGPLRGKLFLAFGDATSALETYGAGRYLDLNKVPGSSTVTLDFNKAYNPYCAYNDTYSCPFPPPQNLLKIAIKAGEKTYH